VPTNRIVPTNRRLRRVLMLCAGIACAAPLLLSGTLAAQPARDIRYVVVHTPGPNWKPGVPVFEQPGLAQHVEHYRKLLAGGKLALGGPYLDPAAGGMMIPEAGVSEQEIRDFAMADPAVQSGLLKAEIRPWLAGMKK